MDEKLMEMPFPELFSKLVVSPVFIIQLLMCISYIIFLREDKGFIAFIGKIYSIIMIVIYLVALYCRFLY